MQEDEGSKDAKGYANKERRKVRGDLRKKARVQGWKEASKKVRVQGGKKREQHNKKGIEACKNASKERCKGA